MGCFDLVLNHNSKREGTVARHIIINLIHQIVYTVLYQSGVCLQLFTC